MEQGIELEWEFKLELEFEWELEFEIEWELEFEIEWELEGKLERPSLTSRISTHFYPLPGSEEP